MANSSLPDLWQHIHRLVEGRDEERLSDQELLERFVAQRDECAFAAIIRRHGPMVLGLARRILSDGHDAEDVFQATFLTLARKATSIRTAGSVSSWLYGVAGRLSRKVRHKRVRTSELDRQARPSASPDVLAELNWREVSAVLDDELAKLPERMRAPLILCCLAGQTQEQAGRQLGWPRSTVQKRLDMGRDLLRRRLLGRGVDVPANFFVASAQHPLSVLPPRLVHSTLTAVLTSESGKAVASAGVLCLVEQAGTAFLASKWKLVAVILLAAGLLGGWSWMALRPDSAELSSNVPKANRQVAGAETGRARARRPAPKQPGVDRYGDSLPAGAVARLGTLRFNHGENLTGLHFSLDGKRIVSVGLMERRRGRRVIDVPNLDLRAPDGSTKTAVRR